MLKVRGLTKKFGKQVANRDISLDCNEGEISILLGPNGAGKSTAIKCILGLLRHEGEITIGGHPGTSIEAKRILTYVPEFPCLYEMLTMEEQFEFIIRAYKLDRETALKDADALIERFRLTERRKQLCKDLSKGMQQKVSIICALLPHPKLLLLDEPMIGLDPHAIKELKTLVISLAKRGVSIVISTHMIASVEGIWDKAYILSRGRVLSCHTKEEVAGLGVDALEKIFFEETEKPELLKPKDEASDKEASAEETKRDKEKKNPKKKVENQSVKHPDGKKHEKAEPSAVTAEGEKKKTVPVSSEVSIEDDPDLAPVEKTKTEPAKKSRPTPPPKKKDKKSKNKNAEKAEKPEHKNEKKQGK